MTQLLYLTDCYMKEFDAVVQEANGSSVVLDRTAFYPEGGGQPSDTGSMSAHGTQYKVASVKKIAGAVVHQLDHSGLAAGDTVHCTIDWERRYRLMRYHTATHLVSAVFHKETGALITGNQLDVDRTRIDLSLENFDRAKIEECVRIANRHLARNLAVTTSFLPREEALKIPGMVKLATALPPQVTELRIVQIGDVDTQADGGSHVSNTSEVGEIELVSMENKGKNNRRIYFRLRE